MERDGGGGGRRKNTAFIHILSSLSLVLSLYWDRVLSSPSSSPFSPLLSYKCHSSLLLAATMDDLFQRERKRKRDEKEKWLPFNLCF